MFEKLADSVARWGAEKVMKDFKSIAVATDDGVVFTCECGQKNRVPFEKIGKTGKCGGCKAPLPTTAFPIDVGASGVLRKMGRQCPVPVVADFWSPTCGPCVIGLPRVEEAAAASDGEYAMVRINLQASPMASSGYDVHAIPTMVRIVQGTELGRSVGLHSTEDIIKFAKTGR